MSAPNPNPASVIYYTIRPCELGLVLVAGTASGLSAVLLGDDRAALVQDLGQRFPRSSLDTGGPALHAWSDAVLKRLADPRSALELPLDIRNSTEFRRRVWQALQAIPPGETRSYAEVAQAIGQPQAVRAVGTACAANALAVIVPCHRVLRGDGSLGSYRWGTARKQQLLALESALGPV